ncbi:hypothetical protein F4X88_16710 [Candidatus Poribacteria bacterium]|nr:hypothetical protein [Candidatus Poribacteria bacterium]
MPSPAALKYTASANRIQTLRRAATNKRLRPMSLDEIQVYYHAALTGYVAAWNAYIDNLVRNFYDVIADPLNPKFDAIHTLAKNIAGNALTRFNTPNWENTRNLLDQYTGYDPINDWGGSQVNMNREQVNQRLNEILRIRHSLAHGSNMPTYNWIQSPSGKIRLTSKAIQETETFFKNLVNVTDTGMKTHIESTYGLANIW